MSDDLIAKLPYRPCVGVMLVNASNQVFVGQRIDNLAEAWQMPQGGIDAGEDPLDAAKRELREETSVEHVAYLAESTAWLSYDLPADLVPKLWGGKFRGQQQKWFLMRLEGDDSQINIATAEPEFRAWRWIDMAKLPDMIVPFKRALYQKLVEEFRPLLMP